MVCGVEGRGEEKGEKRAARWHEARVEGEGKNQSNVSQDTRYGKAIKNIEVPPH